MSLCFSLGIYAESQSARFRCTPRTDKFVPVEVTNVEYDKVTKKCTFTLVFDNKEFGQQTKVVDECNINKFSWLIGKNVGFKGCYESSISWSLAYSETKTTFSFNDGKLLEEDEQNKGRTK